MMEQAGGGVDETLVHSRVVGLTCVADSSTSLAMIEQSNVL